MKLLLAAICSLLCCAVYSQNYSIRKPVTSSDLLRQLRSRPAARLPVTGDTLITYLNGKFAIKKQPGVYSLPQDNMPCIVPDTRSVATIPNAWTGSSHFSLSGKIPNPAIPKTKKQKSNDLFLLPESIQPDVK